LRSLLAAALGLALSAVAGPAARPADPTAEAYDGPLPDRGALVVHDAFGGVHRVMVEIADTQPLRTRGLMWRTELPEGMGMLFIFPTEVVQSFWMRNTLIPLDIVYIRPDGTVLSVARNVPALDESGVPAGGIVRWVLELATGRAAELGLQPGDRITHRTMPHG
jgi:uncharacterized membrane protein (UPF0127 family)